MSTNYLPENIIKYIDMIAQKTIFETNRNFDLNDMDKNYIRVCLKDIQSIYGDIKNGVNNETYYNLIDRLKLDEACINKILG